MAQHTSGRDSWVKRLGDSLADHNYSRHAIKSYSIITRRFLNYLEGRRISIDSVQAAHVDAYLRSELTRYRRKHGHAPDNMQDWRWHFLSPIHKLLTLAQGTWPPLSEAETQVRWFEEELKAEKHSSSTVGTYMRVARGFLNHLHKAGVDLKDAEPPHVLSFIDYELR
jgi:site-specific recombinase XerD